MEGGGSSQDLASQARRDRMRAKATLHPVQSREGGTGCGPTLDAGRVSWLPAEAEHAVEIALALGFLLCHQDAV